MDKTEETLWLDILGQPELTIVQSCGAIIFQFVRFLQHTKCDIIPLPYIKLLPGLIQRNQAINILSHIARKPIFTICEQQRHRSACASAQSDQRLCCSLPG